MDYIFMQAMTDITFYDLIICSIIENCNLFRIEFAGWSCSAKLPCRQGGQKIVGESANLYSLG